MDKKCKWCGKDFDIKESYAKDGFAHCPNCNEPLCDISIQDNDHWSNFLKQQ